MLIVERTDFIQSSKGEDTKVFGIKQCADWTAERICFIQSSIGEGKVCGIKQRKTVC